MIPIATDHVQQVSIQQVYAYYTLQALAGTVSIHSNVVQSEMDAGSLPALPQSSRDTANVPASQLIPLEQSSISTAVEIGSGLASASVSNDGDHD